MMPMLRLVVGMAHQVVDRREVEVHLARVLGLELGRLEVDDDVAAQLQVIEEEVDVEVLVADVEVAPAGRRRRTRPRVR